MGKEIYEWIINLPGDQHITEEELVLADDSNIDDHFNGSPYHKHDSDKDDDEKVLKSHQNGYWNLSVFL